MFTETVMSIMLANILSVAAVLPFIGTQQSLASHGTPSQSSLEGQQAPMPARRARRRDQGRNDPHSILLAANQTKAFGGEVLKHANLEASGGLGQWSEAKTQGSEVAPATISSRCRCLV